MRACKRHKHVQSREERLSEHFTRQHVKISLYYKFYDHLFTVNAQTRVRHVVVAVMNIPGNANAKDTATKDAKSKKNKAPFYDGALTPNDCIGVNEQSG